jgi:uncharacterized protein (TIGR02266 family)
LDTSDQPDIWARLLGLARAMDGRSYYQLLGVTMDAVGEDLRHQFLRRTALIELFPRVREPTPEQKELLALLKARLREAHEVLSDPTLRHRYDQHLSDGDLRLPEAELAAEKIRDDPRAPFSAQVRVSCASWGEFLTLHANNISRGGLFVKTTTPLPKGSAVRLRIVLPQQYTLELDAEVVRSVHAPVAGMGLTFTRMDDFRRMIIDRLVLEARLLEANAALDAPSAVDDEEPTAKYERSPLQYQDLFSRAVGVDQPGSQAVQLGPDQVTSEARALLAQHRFAEAKEKFSQAMRGNTRDLSLRAGFHLAAAYEAKQAGHLDIAHEHFERVLIFDKNCREAIHELRH